MLSRHDADSLGDVAPQLLVKPDNTPARTAYLSWGWQLFGQVKPFADAPVYDSLVRSLPE